MCVSEKGAGGGQGCAGGVSGPGRRQTPGSHPCGLFDERLKLLPERSRGWDSCPGTSSTPSGRHQDVESEHLLLEHLQAPSRPWKFFFPLSRVSEHYTHSLLSMPRRY